MNFGHIPFLEEFLNNLTLDSSQKRDDSTPIVLIPATQQYGIDLYGESKLDQTLELKAWYVQNGRFNFDNFINLITSMLKTVKHFDSRQVALSIIALFAVFRSSEQDPIVLLDKIFASIIKTDVFLFHILPVAQVPTHAIFKSFDIGPYHLGALRVGKLSKLSKKAGSDYFNLYESKLRGRFATDRTYKDVVVLDWEPFRRERITTFALNKTLKTQFELAITDYFHNIRDMLFDQFFNDLSEEQLMTTVYGNTFIDPDQMMNSQFSASVAIFQQVSKLTNLGFVSPRGVDSYQINFAKVDEHIPTAIKELSEVYKFEGFNLSNLHQTLKTYVTYVAKAKRHLWDGRYDDAFMHFAISLDLLFGVEGRSTESVSSRAAIVSLGKGNNAKRREL